MQLREETVSQAESVTRTAQTTEPGRRPEELLSFLLQIHIKSNKSQGNKRTGTNTPKFNIVMLFIKHSELKQWLGVEANVRAL